MSSHTDILVDSGGDLIVQNGDLVTGDAQAQDIQHIVQSQKGAWTQFPLIGVGIRSRLSGPVSLEEIRRDVRLNLKADGFTVNRVDAKDNGDVQIDAQR